MNNLERRYRESSSDAAQESLEEYMETVPCPHCNGKRLKKEALAVTIGGLSIADVSEMPIRACRDFFAHLSLGKRNG